MSPNTMVCSYMYSVLDEFERKLWANALASPLQLHFVTKEKPWNVPSSKKSEVWYSYLVKTPFFHEVMSRFDIKRQKTRWTLMGLPLLKTYSSHAVDSAMFCNIKLTKVNDGETCR